MKQKIRFLELFWPSGKQVNTQYQTSPPTREKTEWRYIVGLLILWLLVMLFSVLRCNAQVKALRVGDTVPDVRFSNVLNYKSSSLKISDFKNKVVVLDFWATWCSSCLAKFPEERELGRRMGDTLQIILVNAKNTHNTHEKVALFFEERRHLYDFPSIDEDTVLCKLIPGYTVPRFAWIINNRIVALPEPEELTEANIRAVYLRQTTHMASGHKEVLDFGKGIVGQASGGNTKASFYSLIAPYRQDLLTSFNMLTDSAGNVWRIDAINMSVSDLVELCSPADNIPNNRIIKKIRNSGVFQPDSTSLKWREKNRFIYESSFSARSSKAALELMRAEISQYFLLRIDTVSRDTDCLVITLGDTARISHGQKGIHGETNRLDHLNNPIFFHNTGMNSVASGLEQHFGQFFIDDSHYGKRINIELPPDLQNFGAVAEAFARQGFHITRARRKLTFLRVQDRSSLATLNSHN